MAAVTPQTILYKFARYYPAGTFVKPLPRQAATTKAENADGKIIQIIRHVIANGSINNSEVQKLLNTSKPTATRLLKQAVK